MSELKYLFEAEFEDGHTILQSPEDRSKIDPEKRSEFYDVCEYEKISPIIRFALTGDGKYLMVDLRDGHFELQGVRFEAHETMPDCIRRLIFYRKHDANLNVVMKDDKVSKVLNTVDQITGYCIGWQTTIEDKNYKETITLN